MTKTIQQILQANAKYVENFGNKNNLPNLPQRQFAILTCMDARLDPAKYAGLVEGDAHVIRNAGGRATEDSIYSLIVSGKLLGTKEWFVIHHTDCGMEEIQKQKIDAQSVLEDVKKIKAHESVPKEISIYGYLYDCKTGVLKEVPEATVAGGVVGA